MIIVEPCAGLGNRFLGMASAYHWAQQTGDELTVLWKTERVMGAGNEARSEERRVGKECRSRRSQ